MYPISAAALISFIALALSLGVVVQATDEPRIICTWVVNSTVTTCAELKPDLNPSLSMRDLLRRIHAFNDNVNPNCTNLVVGKNVCVFLL